jgi:1-deoxy-D-xylulose-5-phosphate synthase
MTKYLDSINDPKDIKKLNINELKDVALEIRKFIINSVVKTGGHLASSLGVVELTLALHYVFDSPKDKLIYDVGHQAYAHKILTGRKHLFSSLRQYGGLSGFLKPHESCHDVFAAGHCSTSISAGLGMVRARDLEEDDYSVVSIIGDGALTGGMAYEALNDAGHAKKKFIIVLNDNAMSIAENVGAMHSYFGGLRATAGYIKLKKEVALSLKKIPGIGKFLYRRVDGLKKRIKYLFVKGVLFEELGFTYIGVVDGHDISKTIRALEKAKRADKPVLVHIHTTKGKGYKPAEKDPERYHGISANGAKKTSLLTNSQVFGSKLTELAKENKKIVAVCAAMPKGTGLDGFKSEFPNRFYDVGIAEQHGVTMCAGLAASGYTPVFAVYSSFLQRAYDQVLHDVCIQNLPVIFALDRAGLVGDDGETHHGVYDISYLSHIPNLTILSPSTEKELELMVEFAVDLKKPVVIRYPRGYFSRDYNNDIKNILEWEEIESVKKVTVIACGVHVKTAVEAFKSVDRPFGLYNARCIKPLDNKALNKIAKHAEKIIVIEDNSVIGGLGSLVEGYFSDKNINKHVYKMGVPDRFITHGKVNLLNEEINLTSKELIKKVLEYEN